MAITVPLFFEAELGKSTASAFLFRALSGGEETFGAKIFPTPSPQVLPVVLPSEGSKHPYWVQAIFVAQGRMKSYDAPKVAIDGPTFQVFDFFISGRASPGG